MSAVREKDSADFDLEAFVDLFDEALTSDDPSVQKTLQHLMVICALARNHARHDSRNGPLRRLFEDIKHLNSRLNNLESQRGMHHPGYGPVPPTNPTIWPPEPVVTQPGTASPNWPGPNQIWCGTDTTAVSVSLPENSAVAQSVGATIAERVDDLLKSNYKGSSVGTVNVKIA
jgi:hypothetical protein